MKITTATVTITGLSPLSQSRQHDAPMLDREDRGDYDKRTWREKLNVQTIDGRKTVVIPAHGLHQCIASAAQYSKRQIPGHGKSTWTKHFTSGISIPEDAPLGVDPADVQCVVISANVDGKRGSGKRVTRRFPIIPEWSTTFEVWILDPIITEEVFREMVDIAGMFIGLGRFRPQNGGTNGRFKLANLAWQDNRQLRAA